MRTVPAGWKFPTSLAILYPLSSTTCSKRLLRRSASPPRNWPTCGGFFDVPRTQKRLGELDSLMAADNFWNNREQAQKLIEEANSLRGKIDPLQQAEKHLDDLK